MNTVASRWRWPQCLPARDTLLWNIGWLPPVGSAPPGSGSGPCAVAPAGHTDTPLRERTRSFTLCLIQWAFSWVVSKSSFIVHRLNLVPSVLISNNMNHKHMFDSNLERHTVVHRRPLCIRPHTNTSVSVRSRRRSVDSVRSGKDTLMSLQTLKDKNPDKQKLSFGCENSGKSSLNWPTDSDDMCLYSRTTEMNSSCVQGTRPSNDFKTLCF